MGTLADCAAVVDPAQLPVQVSGEMPARDRRLAEKNLATLKGFAAGAPDDGPDNRPDAAKTKRVHFLFYAKPDAVLGEGRCTALRLERTRIEDGRAVGTGEFFEVPCGLVVPAIGYSMAPVAGLTLDSASGAIANRDGRVDPGLYVVGWAGRGPSGVIGTNKAGGDRIAELIQADFPRGRDRSSGRKSGRAALEQLLTERGLRRVGFADWERIDTAEVAAAPSGAPRRKLTRIADMLAVLD